MDGDDGSRHLRPVVGGGAAAAVGGAGPRLRPWADRQAGPVRTPAHPRPRRVCGRARPPLALDPRSAFSRLPPEFAPLLPAPAALRGPARGGPCGSPSPGRPAGVSSGAPPAQDPHLGVRRAPRRLLCLQTAAELSLRPLLKQSVAYRF